MSFPVPDKIKGDVKDMVYQLRESPLGTQMRFRLTSRNDRMPGSRGYDTERQMLIKYIYRNLDAHHEFIRIFFKVFGIN